MLWQPEMKLPDFSVTFQLVFPDLILIAFSPLFTNHGNPVLNIKVSKIKLCEKITYNTVDMMPKIPAPSFVTRRFVILRDTMAASWNNEISILW